MILNHQKTTLQGSTQTNIEQLLLEANRIMPRFTIYHQYPRRHVEHSRSTWLPVSPSLIRGFRQ